MNTNIGEFFLNQIIQIFIFDFTQKKKDQIEIVNTIFNRSTNILNFLYEITQNDFLCISKLMRYGKKQRVKAEYLYQCYYKQYIFHFVCKKTKINQNKNHFHFEIPDTENSKQHIVINPDFDVAVDRYESSSDTSSSDEKQ